MQFAKGDPAVAETVMSGAILARCMAPPKLGGSSAAAELIMATVAVKVAIAHRIQAAELRQGPWGATPLYLDALAVLHGTAADQVSREVKYLAAKLAIVQAARSEGKFKRGRLLGLRFTPPARPSSGVGATAGANGAKVEADRARSASPGPAPGT